MSGPKVQSGREPSEVANSRLLLTHMNEHP